MWKLNDENPETLKKLQESTSWDNVMNTEDVNAGFEVFHNIFMRKYTDCCSKKCTRKTGQKKSMHQLLVSHGLLQCTNKKK